MQYYPWPSTFFHYSNCNDRLLCRPYAHDNKPVCHSALLKCPLVFFRCFGSDVIKYLSILKEQPWIGWHLTARRIAETPTAHSDGTWLKRHCCPMEEACSCSVQRTQKVHTASFQVVCLQNNS